MYPHPSSTNRFYPMRRDNASAARRAMSQIYALLLERRAQRLQKAKAAPSEKFGDPTETAADTTVPVETDTNSAVQCTATDQPVQIPEVNDAD